MKNEPVDLAITKAITAFQTISASELQQLPVAVCSHILELITDVIQLADTSELLAQQLRHQLTTTWIEKGELYPVFSAITALWKYNSIYVSKEQLAWAIQRLVACEVAVGGPYASAGKLCLATNAQIALFIRMVAKPLPNVEAFLEDRITAKCFKNTALTTTGLLYLLMKVGDNQELRRAIADHWHQHPSPTIQQHIIALKSRENTSITPEIQQTLMTICRQQQANGFWKGESFVRQNNSYLLTTALILRTLLSYQRRFRNVSPSILQQRHRDVVEAARELFNSHGEPLRTTALTTIDQLCKGDKNFEITLLPQLFAQGLKMPPSLTKHYYLTLGLASLCGWMAYTIYDDFLDNEGTPRQLPLANIAMRNSLEYFRQATTHQSTFMQYVTNIFSAMDEANTWEVTYCRFAIDARHITIVQLPHYGNRRTLAARSFAHALAPLAVLTHSSIKSSKRQLHAIESAFRHYLIARQLLDDLHDWVQDIERGQASYVVVTILRTMRVQPGTYSLVTLIPKMHHRFRQTALLKICQHIVKHIAMAKKHFTNSQLLRRTNVVYSLLDELDLSVRHALDKQQKVLALTEMVAQNAKDQL